MGFRIKIPVTEIQEESVYDKVATTLQNDRNNAYTIQGLMVTALDVKKSDMDDKPFSQWKKGEPTLYSKVRLSLEKLVREKKVSKAKSKKASVYWWTGE